MVTKMYIRDSTIKYELTDRWTVERIRHIYNSVFKAVINTEFANIL